MNESFTSIQVARPLVDAVGRRDRDLASQIRRALSSVALNVGEGIGHAAETLGSGSRVRAGRCTKPKRVYGPLLPGAT